MENNQNIFELAKKLYESDPPEEVKISLEKAFPKLKESEGENIRKEIINYFEHYPNIIVKKEKRNDWITWLEKQGEQKPADKVEPKFHVNEWVVTDKNDVVQIKSVNNGYYTIDNGMDFNMSYVDRYWHKWTIQDAKDGDILVSGEDKHPFIFRGLLDKFHPDNPVAYCGIDYDNKFFITAGTGSIGWWTGEKTEPATKEQRDLLFQRIKEEGYVWDAELKKIEPKLAWTEDDEKLINNLCYFLEEYGEQYYGALTLGAIIGWLNSLKERVQPQSLSQQEWNEEDESMRIRTIGALSSCLLSEVPEEVTEEINWLKSLKYKVQPKQEWGALDERNLQGIIDEIEANKNQAPDHDLATYDRFLSWLKSLKERVQLPQQQWKPSDEQIQVLQWCLPLWNELKTKAVLKSLIADLEKLK